MNEITNTYAADPVSPITASIVLPLIAAVFAYYLVKAVKLRAAGTVSDDPMEQHLGLQIIGYAMIIAACTWAFISTVLG